jgi:hypothetical protein
MGDLAREYRLVPPEEKIIRACFFPDEKAAARAAGTGGAEIFSGPGIPPEPVFAG